MPILAIDTSCDETSVALIQGQFVLSNVVASQAELHQPYGGVFPTVAKQAHQDWIKPTTKLALKRARLEWTDVTAIAVTLGPGLAPALEVGINFAKQLGEQYHLPVIGVNHIEGHILSVLARAKPSGIAWTTLSSDIDFTSIELPALAVVVSGGHTDLFLVEVNDLATNLKYTRLGWTVDDAAGEALDKVGRMLHLGYPAGPVIEQFAKTGNPNRFAFPLPMTASKDFLLSFSGIKTFSRNLISQIETADQLDQQTTFDLAASLQQAVFRHILHKVRKILLSYPQLKSVWLGGGVAANRQLRRLLRAELATLDQTLVAKGLTRRRLKLHTPYSNKLCGDNAAMIGLAASLHLDDKTTLDRRPGWHWGDSVTE